MRVLAACFVGCVLAFAPCARADEAPRAVVHVATVEGEAVADAPYLAAQWETVRTLLGLRYAPTEAPSSIPRAIVTRADRDALAKHVVPGVLNVFVVESLADVDEPGRERMGVHWRAGKVHYVILATYRVPGGRPCPPQYRCDAPMGLLAHELGHHFGLGHDARPDNLMSYVRAGAPLWLDPAQSARIRAASRRPPR